MVFITGPERIVGLTVGALTRALGVVAVLAVTPTNAVHRASRELT